MGGRGRGEHSEKDSVGDEGTLCGGGGFVFVFYNVTYLLREGGFELRRNTRGYGRRSEATRLSNDDGGVGDGSENVLWQLGRLAAACGANEEGWYMLNGN